MVVLRRIVKNGNSAQVTIPTEYLRRARLTFGDMVAIEFAEDGTFWVRRPAARDLKPGADRPMQAEPVALGGK